ncbi:MAG: hypothetical protein J6Q53_02175 [Oscillospiraceae bacterium]|nr:hypothetical protein [Oscillospiraceae bacterium]
MKLNEIVDQIFDIAIAIGYNTISYSYPLLVLAKNKAKPEDLLTAIATPLKQKITNGIAPGKTELTAALKALKEIAKDYQIKELRKPIDDLKAYLDSLG